MPRNPSSFRPTSVSRFLAVLSAALMLLFVPPAQSQPAPAAQTSRRQLTRASPIDLAQVRWVLVESDQAAPPQVSPEKPGKPVTVPGDVAVSGKAVWLITTFDLPALPRDPGEARAIRETVGTILTLGEVGGNDRTFLNDTEIGATVTGLLTSGNLPRRYTVPPEAMRYGETNRLSVRLEPLPGAKTVGLIGGPLTLATLDRQHVLDRLEGFSRAIGRYYRALYRAQQAGLGGTVGFRELAQQTSEIETVFTRAFLTYEQEQSGLPALLQEVSDLIAETERRRFSIEAQALIQERSQQRRLAEEFAQKAGLPVEDIRLRGAGYGRFGKHLQDGLPGLRQISPVRMAAVPDQPIEIRLAGLNRQDVIDISWAHKTTRVVGTQMRETTGGRQLRLDDILLIYYMHASSLFPGAMIEAIRGREMSFQLPYAGRDLAIFQYAVLKPDFDELVMMRYFGTGMKQRSSVEERAHRELVQSLQDEPVITLVVPRVERASPFIIVHEQPSALRLRAMPERTNMSILDIASNAPTLGRLVFIFPLGINTVDAGRIEQEDPEQLPVRIFGDNYQAFLTTFFRFGARFPLKVDEVYAASPGSGRVEIFDRFTYSTLHAGLAESHFPGVLPPGVVQASQAGYPVGMPDNFRLRLSIPGPEGPFYLGTCSDGTLSYSLPVPPMDERALPSVEGQQDLKTLLNALLDDVQEPSGPDVLEYAQGARQPAYLAYSFLEPEKRQFLARTDATAIAAATDPRRFASSEEPFSSIATPWHQAKVGPWYDLYGQEVASARILSGLHTTFRYSGNWSAAEEHAAFMTETLWKRLRVADDWAWMLPSDAERGGGTGLANDTNAVYAGIRAYARIMETLGRGDEAAEATYMLARAAVPMKTRFQLSEYARRNGLIRPESIVLGWLESDGFASGGFSGYPWPVLSLLDAEGIAPEVFDLYLRFFPDDLDAFVKRLQEAWPRWYDGSFNYGRPTPFENNSGRITLPVIYALARLGENQVLLRDYVAEAAKNERFWQMSPPVLAEVMAGHTGIWIEDWDRLQFRGAKWAGGRLQLDLTALRDDRWPALVRLHLPKAPLAAYLNDVPLADFEYDESSGTARLTLDRPYNAGASTDLTLLVDLENLEPPVPPAEAIVAPIMEDLPELPEEPQTAPEPPSISIDDSDPVPEEDAEKIEFDLHGIVEFADE